MIYPKKSERIVVLKGSWKSLAGDLGVRKVRKEERRAPYEGLSWQF